MNNTEIIGESYMAKLALQASSQMGNPHPEFPALSPPTNDSKRLLAEALLNSSPFSQPARSQMPHPTRQLDEQNDDLYAKYVDPASVRAAKKYLPKFLLDDKIV